MLLLSCLLVALLPVHQQGASQHNHRAGAPQQPSESSSAAFTQTQLNNPAWHRRDGVSVPFLFYQASAEPNS